MKNLNAEIFKVPQGVMPSKWEIEQMVNVSVRVLDRGGSIGLKNVKKLDYRVTIGCEIRQIVPGLVYWLESSRHTWQNSVCAGK